MPSVGFTAKRKGYFMEKKKVKRKQEMNVLKPGGVLTPL